MNLNELPPEADALDAFLRGKLTQDNPGLPAEETEMAASLMKAAGNIQPDPGFAAALESQLASIQEERLRQSEARLKRRNIPERIKLVFKNTYPYGRTVALAGLVVVLILAMSWAVKNLIPKPGNPSASTEITATPEVTAVPSPASSTQPVPHQPTETPIFLPSPTLPATLSPGQVALFPKIEFVFANPLPAAPDQVTVYLQKLSEAVTAETARLMAAQMGINGLPVQIPGEGSDQKIFQLKDGNLSINSFNFPDQFVYYNSNSSSEVGNLSFEQRVTIAEEFLSAHGLLNYPYHTEQDDSDPGTVRFVQLLDDRPVIYGIGVNGEFEWISVTVDANGQVSSVGYAAHHFEPAGQFPVLSAQQAWERLSSADATMRSTFAVLPAEQPSRYWERTYPLGQLLHLYGLVSTSPSGEGLGFRIWGLTTEWPLTGNTHGLEDYIPFDKEVKIVHIWGQLEETGKIRILSVTGWEPSPSSGEYRFGTIQLEGNQGRLTTTDGQEFILPDIPADLWDGAMANVVGVAVTDTVGGGITLEWFSIDTRIANYGISNSCFGGGGGGGGGPLNANFGSGNFAMLNLDGNSLPSPTEVPTPVSPYQVGDAVDEVTGTVYVTIYRYAEGRTKAEAWLWVQPSEAFPQYWGAKLEGALSGIEQFHTLPIKIWGQVDRMQDGNSVVTVDRYEAAYPGLSVQAWLGTAEQVNLEGKEVVLFTTQENQKVVFASSIDLNAINIVGLPGSLLIVEGWIDPTRTFGGYPLLTEISLAEAVGRTDLSGYQITSNQPTTIDETQSSGSSPDQYLQGRVTIESVELVYSAISLSQCAPGNDSDPAMAGLYVQPVWVFKGRFEDGRRFEIQVQALPDVYLK